MDLKEMNWLVIVVTAVLAGGLLRGYLQGGLRILCTVVGLVAGIALSVWGGPLISSALQDTKIADRIEQSIEKTLQEKIEMKVLSSDNIEKALEENLHLPGVVAKKIADADALKGITKKTRCFEVISEELTTWVMKVLTMAVMALTFFAICLAASLASGLLNRIPVFGPANRLIGAAICGGEALLIVWVFFAVLSITVTGRISTLLRPDIEDSAFLNFLFENNPLLSLWNR